MIKMAYVQSTENTISECMVSCNEQVIRREPIFRWKEDYSAFIDLLKETVDINSRSNPFSFSLSAISYT
jgi:hypothetical protein